MTRYIILACVGGLFAFLLSFYWKASAAANVAVRPELAKVDFWTALLAGHAGDWLWYLFPDAMTVVSVVIGVIIGVLVALWID